MLDEPHYHYKNVQRSQEKCFVFMNPCPSTWNMYQNKYLKMCLCIIEGNTVAISFFISFEA